MKKALFLALSLAFLLTACGEAARRRTRLSRPRPATRRKRRCPRAACYHYDLGEASVLAEDKSLPLAQNAGDGYATSYSVWYDGADLDQVALQDGDSGISVADMTGGSAVVRLRRGARRLERRALPLRAPGPRRTATFPTSPPTSPAASCCLKMSGDCWADGGAVRRRLLHWLRHGRHLRQRHAAHRRRGHRPDLQQNDDGILRDRHAPCRVRHHDGRKRLPALPAK